MSYFIYTLRDSREIYPFYVGKGMGDRPQSHLKEAKNLKTKNHKVNTIRKIWHEGGEIIIEKIVNPIEDEKRAYEIEEFFIDLYGIRQDGGMLVNVCRGENPPNHKGKTYEEIYGEEEGKKQKKKRAAAQKKVGGYGPKSHSKKTKKLISNQSKGFSNGNSTNITEEEIMKYGEEFCQMFDFKVSFKKWNWFKKEKSIQVCDISYRFNRKNIYKLIIETFNADKVYEIGMHYTNKELKKSIRISQWEIDLGMLPIGYEKGRK